MVSDTLVIDDQRVFWFDCEYARDSQIAEQMLFRKSWRFVWWDHDLGSDTTVPLARLIEEMAFNRDLLNVEMMIIHSDNPVGRQELFSAFVRYYPVKMVHASDFLSQ